MPKSTQREFVEAARELTGVLSADIANCQPQSNDEIVYFRPAADYVLKLLTRITRLISNAKKYDHTQQARCAGVRGRD